MAGRGTQVGSEHEVLDWAGGQSSGLQGFEQQRQRQCDRFIHPDRRQRRMGGSSRDGCSGWGGKGRLGAAFMKHQLLQASAPCSRRLWLLHVTLYISPMGEMPLSQNKLVNRDGGTLFMLDHQIQMPFH